MRNKHTEQMFFVTLLQEMRQLRQAEQCYVKCIQILEERLIDLEQRMEKNGKGGKRGDAEEYPAAAVISAEEAVPSAVAPSPETECTPVKEKLQQPPGFVQCFLCAHAARNRECPLCLWDKTEAATNVFIALDPNCDGKAANQSHNNTNN